MSVASRLRKNRKTNVWPYVLAVVMLITVVAGAVAAVSMKGSSVAANSPEQQAVLVGWYEAEHQSDYGKIVRWSVPYNERDATFVAFRFQHESGEIVPMVATIKNGRVERVALQSMTHFAYRDIEWAD